ncbi:MAG: NUDIX hydrolase [Rhodothermales bacterium]|nr:NUDIX hydrolase [Rhodothermales bacterium]
MSDINPTQTRYGDRAEILPPEPDAPKGNAFRVRAADGDIYYAYRFPHPAVAASVVVFDRSRGACLLIQRSFDPFKGYFAFPGGFLDVGRERIEETAARELLEEAGVTVDPAELKLVDVRSDPQRDPRDHVFDIAYFIAVDRVDASALDEASDYHWATPAELDALPLAFDHAELWKHVKAGAF